VELQERGEIVVPAGLAKLRSSIEQASTDNSPVVKESVLEQSLGGEPGLPNYEDEEQDEANNQHGNDLRSFSTARSAIGNIEGKEEHDLREGTSIPKAYCA
jgi:hypothetical protein